MGCGASKSVETKVNYSIVVEIRFNRNRKTPNHSLSLSSAKNHSVKKLASYYPV